MQLSALDLRSFPAAVQSSEELSAADPHSGIFFVNRARAEIHRVAAKLSGQANLMPDHSSALATSPASFHPPVLAVDYPPARPAPFRC